MGTSTTNEATRQRLEPENPLIERAKRHWNRKVTEQIAHASVSAAALARLFEHTPGLRRIEIDSWSVNLEEHGFRSDMSERASDQFTRRQTAWENFEFLAVALQTSNRHIKELILSSVSGMPLERNGLRHLRGFTDTIASAAAHHIFSGLTTLDLDFAVDPFYLYQVPLRPAFSSVLKTPRSTIRTLKIRFNDDTSKVVCDEMENLLYEPATSPPTRLIPLIYPNLKELELSSLAVDGPSLANFLSQQPVLETVSLNGIYIWTAGFQWSTIAAHLPSSCKTFHVKGCGQDAPLDYRNYFVIRCLYTSPMPHPTGWLAKKLSHNLDYGSRIRVYQVDKLSGNLARGLEYKMRLTFAAFERIGASGDAGKNEGGSER
ncbi:hypothetical protein BDV95DRAFT_224697 [Massariosphaeria phaeospora]|uniref:Uncharacterized protein n=1 Tax=Massariosphaeria phaeospora TaxID=100035 RepID=A0A7C8MEN8_9PLEO|nr:hypothetical protein BDV95DRAFT_224697 [Massariosphaeria phaeospora]